MSALDLFLVEVKAYDYKWFDEIGGNDVLQEIGTLRAQLAEAQKAVNEAADIFQFVANEDMQIMENGYQTEEMAGHWISKYSKLVTTA